MVGRKNIVSKRITEILDGKLLRFTDILKEYERLHHKKAFKQIADNLKLQEKNKTVVRIGGRFCLAKDLYRGSISEADIKLAHENNDKLKKQREHLQQITDAQIERKIQRLIMENDHEKIRNTISSLKEGNYLLGLILKVEVPLQSEYDRDRIQHLISFYDKIITQLQHILELGVFGAELEKSKRLLNQYQISFDKLSEATLSGLNKLIEQKD